MYYILLISTAFAIQYVPIPDTPNGYVASGATSKLVIEAYYDLVCPDSKDQFETLEKVKAEVGADKFKYVIRMFPLPYHKAAFPAAQGFRYLAKYADPQAAYLYTKIIFENQDQLSDLATMNLTWQQVIDLIAQLTADNVFPTYAYDKAKFAQSLLPGTSQNLQSRYEWKLGVSRSVSGTPVFFAQGILFDGAELYDQASWVTFINSKQ